ncbi:FAD-dependent oxidoreductase, partial [Nguyenibacter vanlangensis]|nr:FAD-dependent oxidoreductase [Nguyenibacter vanlangensis]
MIRLTEIRLPLDHPPEALEAEIVRRLGVVPGDLLEHGVFRRGYDARRRGAVVLVYTVDCAVRDEAAVLARL